MAKKIVKKRKVKILNLLIFFMFIGIISLSIYGVTRVKIKNIIIKNTSYLNDDYIIDLAGIKNYPSFVMTNSDTIEKKLLKSKYIHNVKIKKRFNFILEIDVTENRPLFYDSSSSRYVLSDNSRVRVDNINSNFRVPRLLNYVPDNKYNKFFKGMVKIHEDTLSKISDIEYVPNDYDKDRFLLYMDDSNMVYLTLTKFKMINRYNEVLESLENHKGILYLDSGNHFKIME